MWSIGRRRAGALTTSGPVLESRAVPPTDDIGADRRARPEQRPAAPRGRDSGDGRESSRPPGSSRSGSATTSSFRPAIESHYPFADDGRATWPTTTPYFDALIALALIAAATERATIGTAVLVLPLRHPVVFAKQAASIDVASGGRLQLGVGAGWLREEFDALNVPFEDRGRRLVEWMEIARDCWTGTPAARSSERYTLPEGVLCLPTPAQPIPFLMGGHSPAALRRAGPAGGGLARPAVAVRARSRRPRRRERTRCAPRPRRRAAIRTTPGGASARRLRRPSRRDRVRASRPRGRRCRRDHRQRRLGGRGRRAASTRRMRS